MLGNSHGRRSLESYSPCGLEESDTTERLHFHFSLSCVGEGNGNPLQCSCLENPRDGGAWWAAVYGVAQSQARLKRLGSSSRSSLLCRLFSSCGEQRPLSGCSAQASLHVGFSGCGARALGCPGSSSCSSQALEHKLSSCGAQA